MAHMMDAKDLARWTRFANKGGIGKCTAVRDCVAQGTDDLMFLIDDEITVLMQLTEENMFLGYCEGVVGRFNGKDVRFHGKLKKPVIQKRASNSTASLKSVSPIHSPSLPRDEDLQDLGLNDPSQSGRLSLPPLPKSSRTSSITEDIQEKFNANRPKSAISNRSPSRPSSSRPSSPRTTMASTANKRNGGPVNTEPTFAPSVSPVPSSSDDHTIYSLNEYPFPKPPTTTIPNPSMARSTSVKKRVESMAESNISTAASASSRRSTSTVSRSDVTRDSAFSTTLDESVLSVTLDDDIETGIGLRLLAGLSGSEDDDFSDEEEDRTATMFRQVYNSLSPQATSQVQQPESHSRSQSQPQPQLNQVPLSPNSIHTTHLIESPPISPRSTYDDSMDSEWDGGADIYDTYRYSRYSTSAKSSRTSTPRGGPLGSYFTDKPLQASSRERKESNTSSNAKFDKRRSTATTASVYSEHDSLRPSMRRMDGHEGVVGLAGNDRDTLVFPMPPTTEPLNFVKKNSKPSPLNLENASRLAPTSSGVSASLVTPPMTTPPAPLTPSSKHASSGTNQSRSPLLHTTFASPTTSVYSQTSTSQTNAHPFPESDTSDARSTIASDITERNVFESVEVALRDTRDAMDSTSGTGARTGSALSNVRERVVTGRKDSADTVIENVDENVHQDEEIIVFSRADIPRRSIGHATATISPENTTITESSISIAAITDPPEGTALPTTLAEVSGLDLEPPPPLIIDHTSPPSPTPAYPPSPSVLKSQTPPIDPTSLPHTSGSSLFPPHPFAPKAPTDGSRHTRGPSIHRIAGAGVGTGNINLYGSQTPSPQQPQFPRRPVSPSLAQTLRELAMTYTNPARLVPNQLRRVATIHGRTEKDLASSSGPVPIAWSVDGWREREIDKEKEVQPKKTTSKVETRMTIMMPQLVKRGSKPNLKLLQHQQQPKAPIPRANFSPSAGTSRPRSRSFSEVGENVVLLPSPPKTASPSSPQASPKVPPSKTGSPLSGPASTRSPPSVQLPLASIQTAGVQPSPRTVSSNAMGPDFTTRGPAPRAASPTLIGQTQRIVSNPPPRTVTLDPSKLGLVLVPPNTTSSENRPESQTPQTPLTAVPRNFGTPPVQPPLPSIFGDNTPGAATRVLTRSPSPLDSSVIPPSMAQIVEPQVPSPRAGVTIAQMNVRSRPSTDSQDRLEQSPLSNGIISNPLVPPVRRTTSPLSDLATRSAASSPGMPTSQAASPPTAASVTMRSSLRKAQSSASLRSTGSRSSIPKPNFDHPFPFGEEGKPSMSPAQLLGQRSSRLRSISRTSHERRPSVDTTRSTDYTDSVYTHHTQQVGGSRENESTSSPPISPVRTASLRSRKSFSQLRTKGIKAVRELASPTQIEFEEETIQVKDMEFELVKPIIRHRGDYRNSEESTIDSKEALSPRPELRPDAESLRSFSPAMPVTLTPDAQSPAASSVDSFSLLQARQAPAATPSPLADVNHEAHRARELKWISSISSIPSNLARKNKKIRKLLQDPVPDSVRYLVWAHVLDAKAKRIPNVYSQIGNRPKGPISEQIERDAQRCFTQQPHLRDPKGPLISVVNAYLAMVPDIRYHPGLTVIAGHLLLQSPEEDAFWILLALMETHLRPFYSLSGTQLEADAYLFTKVLENVDSQLAHVLFVDLRVRPIDLCRGWFPSIFSGVLPNTHIHRIWDLLFYEGPIFLFRVGVTLLQLSRRIIIQHLQSPQPVLPMLMSPDPELLPHAEIFLNHVLSLKLSDSDLRKQRIKMEASRRPPQRTATTSRLRNN